MLGAICEVVVLVDGAALVIGVAVVVVVVVVAAAVLEGVEVQSLFVAVLPRLPPLMAFAVAVQPAPGVDVCATAKPPVANVAAAIRAMESFFMDDSWMDD